jgi:hypothetical protein
VPKLSKSVFVVFDKKLSANICDICVKYIICGICGICVRLISAISLAEGKGDKKK